jgi:anoctamin-10
MVIQFGYLALFSSVWPLIPIGFFINNWLELRSDFLKICIEHQRPTPVRADGIGPWVSSLEALTWLGSISSAAIVHLFGTQPVFNFAFAMGNKDISRWWTLPITIFVSEHIFLGFRCAVRFALQKIGSKETRRERKERYTERKKFLDELERKKVKSGDFSLRRERRKSVRLESLDLFWSKQVDDGASRQVGMELIRMTRNKEKERCGTTKEEQHMR